MSTNCESIKIYLLSNDFDMCCAWRTEFSGVKNVEIVCGDFLNFMQKYKVDCVVSPANGYGLMDGGYDQAITDWFGAGLQEKVQRYIVDRLYGEQPVGTSIIFDTGIDGVKLIHTPTMRYPERIVDPCVVYHCTRTCLMCAFENDIKSVVIPAFGAATGELTCDVVARMMHRAFVQLSDPPAKIDWDYARASRMRF